MLPRVAASDGTIVGWGLNGYGQADTPDGNDFLAVAAGGWHSLALASDGSLLAWGDNSYNQTDVPEPNDFAAIAAGWYHSVGIAGEAPWLMLTDPNGRENLIAGRTHAINWQSQGYIPNVLLEYSSDNGTNWTEIAADANNTGSYDWLAPQLNSDECLVRVSGARYWRSVVDISAEPFIIYQCTLSYDLNGDCFVDFADFGKFASEWLGCGNPFDPNCGP